MPEIAKKLGKIMNEFRGTANEFKDTWQREVSFEEEAKALDLNALDEEPVARVESDTVSEPETAASAPAIKEIDPAKFEELKASAAKKKPSAKKNKKEPQATNGSSDKKNWL